MDFLRAILRSPLGFFHAVYLMINDKINPKDSHPYGVYGYVGLYGGGKSLAMTRELFELKKKYPKCKIATNYGFIEQDYAIEKWEDIVDLHDDNGLIICLDEIQNDFFSRNFQSMPQEILFTLTQCRKLKKMILYTTPLNSFADSVFRGMTHKLHVMWNPFRNDRFFISNTYYADEYKPEMTPEEKQARVITRWSFVAVDAIRESYNSMAVISSIRGDSVYDKHNKKNSLDNKEDVDNLCIPAIDRILFWSQNYMYKHKRKPRLLW